MSTWCRWYLTMKRCGSRSGRLYFYDQSTRRSGGVTETRNRYVGPVGGARVRSSMAGHVPDSRIGVDETLTSSRRVTRDDNRKPVPVASARARVVIDAEREAELLDAAFDAAAAAPVWRAPWRGRGRAVPVWEPDARLFRLAAALGLKGRTVGFGPRSASVAVKTSRLTLPEASQFVGDNGASAAAMHAKTVLHELIHATGFEAHLARDGMNLDAAIAASDRLAIYAREELIAELGAQLMSERLGYDRATLAETARYVQNWRRRLPDDPEIVAAAKREAVRAADYLSRLWDGLTPNEADRLSDYEVANIAAEPGELEIRRSVSDGQAYYEVWSCPVADEDEVGGKRRERARLLRRTLSQEAAVDVLARATELRSGSNTQDDSAASGDAAGCIFEHPHDGPCEWHDKAVPRERGKAATGQAGDASGASAAKPCPGFPDACGRPLPEGASLCEACASNIPW